MPSRILFLCACWSGRARLAASLLEAGARSRFEVWSTPAQNAQEDAVVEHVLQEQEIALLSPSHLIQPTFDMQWDEGIILCSGLTDTWALSGIEGRQDMSLLSRRQLLELGIAAFISCLAHLDSKHISAIEQEELGRALGQSIADGWKLFHTIGNAKMLAVSQMQLSLIHQAHAFLHSSTRSYLYTGAYGLVGLALHHENRHEDALQAYHRAHMAAMATGDVWHIAQCLLSQANVYLALGRYVEAIQVLEEAYSYLGDISEEHRRTKAHLLGVWADTAITTKDFETARWKLDAVAALLDHIPPMRNLISQAGVNSPGTMRILLATMQPLLNGMSKRYVNSKCNASYARHSR